MQSNDFTKSIIAASLLVITFMIFWEFYWRSEGYTISYNEDKVMWASARKRVYLPPDQATVFVGDSRVKFDIDIPTWKALTGRGSGSACARGHTAKARIRESRKRRAFQR
jgi:hypothetical protein